MYVTFSVDDIALMARKRIQERRDAIIFWVGSRGVGKSTINWKFCHRLGNFEVEHLGVKYKAGNFIPEKDMIYSREDAIRFIMKSKYKICDIDELIGVGYNREFSREDQQTIIKSVNQYRSNFNIISANNPFFYDLDQDLRNLCWMRVDIIRRGMGLVHTPVESIYKNDPWDTVYNKKVEESWRSKGVVKPKYNQLTAFRGILLFGPLPLAQEQHYERIRDEKRAYANRVLLGEDINPKDMNIYDKMTQLAIDGKLTKEGIEQACVLHSLKYTNVLSNLNKRLKDKNIGKTLMELIPKQEKPSAAPGYTLD